jgi:hypothetical protein
MSCVVGSDRSDTGSPKPGRIKVAVKKMVRRFYTWQLRWVRLGRQLKGAGMVKPQRLLKINLT